jgi:2-dehydropantoate 2-reductase
MNTAIFNNFIVIPFLSCLIFSAKLYHNFNQCRKITGKKMNDSPIIAIVGFGSLGALFASLLAPNMPFENLRIVADTDRVNRYQQQGLLVNGEPLILNYVTPNESLNSNPSPADLVMVCTKFYQLNEVLPLIKSQLSDNTLIVSALNGIASEKVLANAFGDERIVYCVAQQMDAMKNGSQLIYRDHGQLVIGTMTTDSAERARVQQVDAFFNQVNFPHSVSDDMPRQLWGKLMLNTGVNQTVSLYQGTFDTVQQAGEAREMFKAAMREVMAVAHAEGVTLTEEDFKKWLAIMDALDPKGMPSMRQDLKAGRRCELDLFAGTIRELGDKHGIDTPVNDTLYDGISALMTNNQS